MAEIVAPSGLILDDLRLLVPSQVNRSRYTGMRKVIGLPGTSRWRGSISLPPITTEIQERAWRAFLFGLRGQVNTFRYYLPCHHGISANPLVDTGAAHGFTLPLKGLPVSVTAAQSGQFLTVPLSGGRFRTVCLQEPLVANNVGKTTARFEPALTEVPSLDATVEVVNPFLMLSAMTDDLGLSYENGVSGASFDVEEVL